jgi:hypothetical protein
MIRFRGVARYIGVCPLENENSTVKKFGLPSKNFWLLDFFTIIWKMDDLSTI